MAILIKGAIISAIGFGVYQVLKPHTQHDFKVYGALGYGKELESPFVAYHILNNGSAVIIHDITTSTGQSLYHMNHYGITKENQVIVKRKPGFMGIIATGDFYDNEDSLHIKSDGFLMHLERLTFLQATNKVWCPNMVNDTINKMNDQEIRIKYSYPPLFGYWTLSKHFICKLLPNIKSDELFNGQGTKYNDEPDL